MSYKITHYNGTLISVVNDGTIDKTLDITLVGKNYAGYGAVQNENFTYLLENFASVNPPPKPIPGQLWYDSGNKKVKFYDGSKFRTGGTTEISSTEPTGLTIGDFWWDSINHQLHAYTGNGFALIGPQVAAGSGATEMIATTVLDNTGSGQPHAMIQAIVNGEVVYVISGDTTYTLDPSANPIPGFTKIHQGVTMAYAVEYNDDDDFLNHRYWGTSRDSDRLGGIPAANFVQTGDAAFRTTVNFSHNGFTVGNPNEILRVRNPDSQTPHIENIANESIVFSTTTNDNASYPLTLWRSNLLPGGISTPTTVGNTEASRYVWYSDNVNNIGASWARFNSVYASNFVGIATKADTFLINGAYQAGSVTTVNNTIVARDNNGDIFATTLHGNATNATLAVTATKADTLKVGGDYRFASVNTSPNSVVVRDANGNINATVFNGNATNASLAANATNAVTSEKADSVNVSGSYRTASTGTLPNTIAARDANSDLWASTFHGNATNASLAANATNAVTAEKADSVKVAGNYRTASVTATANTVAVRDGNGDLFATTFHGNSSSSNISTLATNAENLQVDGNYFRIAATSASADTITARDGFGAINATAFRGTLSGTVTGSNSMELVRGNMGDNDLARILIGATGSNAGYLEIATADDGTEPIYVRQYTGVFGAIARTATLLDASGNTSFPGTVSASTFSGNASTASSLQSFNNPTTSQTPNTIAYRDGSGDLWTNVFRGTATSANYADLAEKYLADVEYEVGTVVCVGGEKEVTACQWGDRAIGAVSANPAYMMNSELEGGTYIALKGRVPVKVTGAIKKGQRLVAANDGTAMAAVPHANDVFAIALGSSDDTGVKVVEALIL